MAHKHSHDHSGHSYKAAVKKLPATGEVEIQSQISAVEFDEAVKSTLASLKKNIELPGFRKGAAPEKIVREKIGEAALLHEAAEHAISHAYGHILEAEKIDAIGYPKVSITKIAAGNPLEFTITTAVVPEIKNFDYKKIAAKENSKKAESADVTDAEVEKAVEDIKNNYGKIRAKNAKTADDAKTEPVELTDEVVKTWGDFKNVADFKAKLRENLGEEKKQRALEKRRVALIDALTGGLDIVVPNVLVEVELGRMMGQMRHDIERMGLKFEEYLAHLKKTEADLKKEWNADAIKRVKLDLLTTHIAKEEKLVADAARIDAEMKHAGEHHKDIDPERARAYFEHVFLNQAVFEFLEKQK